VRKQTNRLSEDSEERIGELRVSYVGEPTVGDGGGMWKRGGGPLGLTTVTTGNALCNTQNTRHSNIAQVEP
jgi:hypothetical protein